MAGVWLLSWRLRNAGIVDIAWAAGFTPVAAWYALHGPGFPFRKLLIAVMAATWSLRLAWHLFRRVTAHLDVEDGRYAAIRAAWGAQAEPKMAAFFQVQGLLILALSTPFLLACWNPSPAFHPLEIAGALLWLIALAGESLADAQLRAFKADPAHRGQVCRTGLWAVSRHPNYFFEWLVWVAFFVFASASPWGWVTIACPVLMWHFLINITGIKATEEQSLKNRGDAYRRYQAEVSAFVPWFPKSS
jgi:steroid 5-alpha reductase family enzyme